jgi:hypothetical protein
MATQLTAQISDGPQKKQVAIDLEVVKKIAHVAVRRLHKVLKLLISGVTYLC